MEWTFRKESEDHMSDWIRVRASEIRFAEKEKKAAADRQSQALAALKAKVEPFWNDLMGLLEHSVKTFNAEFPEPERRIDHFEKSSSSGLVIEKRGYPTVFVRAQLNGGATSVNYSITTTQRKGADAVAKQGNLTLDFSDGEVGFVDGVGNHEDVAKLFLEPFFQF
jgi:hypothetical protein